MADFVGQLMSTRKEMRLSLRLSRALAEETEQMAMELGKTRSELIREALLVLLGIYRGMCRHGAEAARKEAVL